MSFFGLNKFGLSAMLVLPLLAIIFIRKKISRPKININLENISIASLIIFELVCLAVVLSPMVLTQNVNGFNFLEFTGINDFYKHVYALTAILQSGLPAVHPYFSPASFSYYYGYYLIPAATAHILNLGYNLVMFVYPLLTTTVTFIFLLSLIKKAISRGWIRVLVIAILIFGTGLDIFPTLKINDQKIRHIESWSQHLDLGFIVNNTFMSYLWVPQHVIAAIALIYLVTLVKSSRSSPQIFLTISFGLVYIALTSFFVMITGAIWFIAIFLSQISTRRKILISGLISTVTLLPYITQLSNRVNLFSTYTPGFLTLIENNNLLNRLLNILIEYGPICFITLIGSILVFKSTNHRILGFALFILPLLITWIIRTPPPNDFGMRSILPIQLLVPIATGIILENTKKIFLRGLILTFVILNLLISGYGFVFEHVNSWKDRRILTLNDSQLLTWTRSLPHGTRLATYQKEDWAFYIPPLGFKTNLSPHLYDSGVYIAGSAGKIHAKYETDGKNIFSGRVFGSNIDEVINTKQADWNLLHEYLNYYPFDYFIVTQKEWVRKGVNPWFTIFNLMGNKPELIGNGFATYSQSDLLKTVASYKITIDKSSPIELSIQNNHLQIAPGFWYLIGCNSPQNSKILVDLEQYYSLLDYTPTGPGCIGNTLLVTDSEPIKISSPHFVNRFFAYKILVSQK